MAHNTKTIAFRIDIPLYQQWVLYRMEQRKLKKPVLTMKAWIEHHISNEIKGAK